MKKYLAFLITFWIILGNINAQQFEYDYVELINQHFNGQREFSVTSGRVDILTDEYAIEVEFANKWKGAIGQSLWYALQTNKKPGIVLVKKDLNQNKYVIQLGSALDYAELRQRIKVWVYPDDFQNIKSTVTGPTHYGASNSLEKTQKTKATKYWMTSSSRKRHNSSCRYYNKSNGRFCSESEGIACKVCGG